MEPVLKIELPKWLKSAAVQKLMEIIGGDKVPATSMFVGGAVRNTLLEKTVADIDIATQLTPEEVMKKLTAENIKVIPTGIDHGTVTAVIEGQPFEITTLRHDDKTDGRHAEVSFTDDWIADAKRRDFTLNTLLMDMSGNIFDPTGLGMSDLKARRIVFVGEASQRVSEDYLRILRFFRFHAQYGVGEPDAKALAACKDAAGEILSLSRERITQEFLKITDQSNAPKILNIMFENNILSDVFDEKYQSKTLAGLIELQEKYKANNIMSRLFVLAGNKARFFEDYFRLSHAQKKFLIKLEMVAGESFYKNEPVLKKAIFHHGNELLLQGYLLVLAKDGGEECPKMIEILTNWQAPKCPITGDALIKEGYQTGPDLGQELKRRQDEWLDENI